MYSRPEPLILPKPLSELSYSFEKSNQNGNSSSPYGGMISNSESGILDTNKWLKSIIFDINGDFKRKISDSSHPNYQLLKNHDDAFKAHQSSGKDEDARYSVVVYGKEPLVHPKFGYLFNGNYSKQENIKLGPKNELFNPTGFTLLMRVFVDRDSESIVTFGAMRRWFGLTKTHITLNNQQEKFSFPSPALNGQWNDIWISFNNAQDPQTYSISDVGFSHVNTNNAKEIHIMINGEGQTIPLKVNINAFALTDYSIESEKGLSFINYSNGACLKGMISSIILLNESCPSLAELKQVAEVLMEHHNKPTDTYLKAVDSLTTPPIKSENITSSEPSISKPIEKTTITTTTTTKSQVQEIHSTEEFERVKRVNRLIVVDFFATWCAPCKQTAPLLDELSSKFDDLKFVKVDIDKNGDIKNSYQINSIPAFLFIKDNRVVNTLVGANEETLNSYVKSLSDMI